MENKDLFTEAESNATEVLGDEMSTHEIDNEYPHFDDGEFVDPTYKPDGRDIAKKIINVIFPFANPEKSSLFGFAAFILGAVFFALPAMLSLLSFIFPAKDFLNYIAHQTQSFFHTSVIVLYIVMAWIVIGHLIGCVLYKKMPLNLGKYKGFGEFLNKNKVRIMFAVLLIIMTVTSNYFSTNPKNSFENLTDGLYVWYKVALAAICISLVKDKKQQRILLVIFGISALMTAPVMFRQYIEYYKCVDYAELWTTDFSQIHPSATALRQLRGIFANSNHYGYYLSLGTLCITGLFVTGDKVWKKILWGIALAIMINTVILNNTLGSILAVFLILLLTPLAFIKSNIKWYMRVMPIVILIAVSAFVSLFPQLPMGSTVITEGFTEIKMSVSKLFAEKEEGNDENEKGEEKEASQSIKKPVVKPYFGDSQGSYDPSVKHIQTPPPEQLPSDSDLSEGIRSELLLSDNNIMLPAPDIMPSADEPTPTPDTEKVTEDSRWWLKNQSVGTGRLGLWQYGIELMRHQPLTGYGINGTKDLFVNASGLDSPAARVHNEYLQIGIDCGIPAMVLHLVALFTVVGYFFVSMHRNTLYNEQRILFLMFAAYCVSAFTGICAYYTASFFYIILALLVSTFEGMTHEYPASLVFSAASGDDSDNAPAVSDDDSDNAPADTTGEISPVSDDDDIVIGGIK